MPVRDLFRDYRAKIGKIDERIGTSFKGSGDVDEPLTSRMSRWMQQFGFSSSPPAGTEIAILETDAGPCAVGSDHTDGEPDLAPGWSAQYDLDGNYVRFMREDGVELVAVDGKIVLINGSADDIEIVANGGGDVVVENGAGQILLHSAGALDAARKTDKTGADTTMAAWIAKVQAVVVAIDPTTIAPTDFGAITGGSSNVKIG